MEKVIKELIPINDRAKSFYKKAFVKIEGADTDLISYGTCVAGIHQRFPWCNGGYDMTTTRHIREFFSQYTNNQVDTTIKGLSELPNYEQAEEMAEKRRRFLIRQATHNCLNRVLGGAE